MTKVKICGIRSLENALMVAEAGADMIGLNFYPETPRYIEPQAARAIAAALRESFGDARPRLIGIFVNASAADIRAIMDEVGLDLAQLSGDEPLATIEALPGAAFKAIRPANETEALNSADSLRRRRAEVGIGAQPARRRVQSQALRRHRRNNQQRHRARRQGKDPALDAGRRLES